MLHIPLQSHLHLLLGDTEVFSHQLRGIASPLGPWSPSLTYPKHLASCWPVRRSWYPLAYFWLALWCLLVVLVLLTGQISPFTGLHLTTCVERKRRCASGTLWCNGSASDSSWEGCMFTSCRGHPKASSVSAFKVNLGVHSYKLIHRNYVFQKTCQRFKMYSCWLN